MEGWIIIGSAMAVAVSLGAIYDRRTTRRRGQVNTQPDRSPYSGNYHDWPQGGMG